MVSMDYETRSEVDLHVVGLDNYLRHPSTQILMLGWAIDESRVNLWQPHLDSKMPQELVDNVLDPFQAKSSWNVSFERGVFKHILGMDVPLNEWRDPMIQARSLSIGSQLSVASKILGLGEDEAKMAEGTRLKNLFCMPQSLGGKETLFGISKATFRDWTTDKDDWSLFCDYCKMDVVAERAAAKKMERFPLPEQEWENWILDQVINERGVPVKMELVRGASVIATREVDILIKKLKELTNLENPNSTDQLLGWVQKQGYPFSSLAKAFVARAMGGEAELTEVGREVLEIRKMTSKSSISKYSKIADTVSSDGRLRFQFAFMGAGRTGRWSGKGSSESSGVQLQNLSRPTKQVEKKMDLAVDLVQKMDYEGIKKEFGQPLEVVTSVVRASFQAPPGKKLIIADLASIESRGLGFLARCETILNVFREGRDTYLDFAVDLYGKPYEELLAEYKAGDSTKRTNSKPAQLGCGYRLSGGEEQVSADGDKFYSGLMGYARNMNIELSQEEAHRSVAVFRKKYKEVVQLWYDLEDAMAKAIRNPGHEFGVGVPNNQKEIEEYRRKGRTIHDKPLLIYKATGKSMLQMFLPSGRALHYVDPRAVEKEFTSREGRTYKKTELSYWGQEQGTHNWAQILTHGGKALENGDQAWARDILVHGMHKAEEKGFEVVGHVHDELITLVDVDSPLTKDDLCACMSAVPDYMPPDFPLAAEGFESLVYRKN